ncbi:hypothetical protein [Bacillus cereus]|uniref:hypothetical protein n=1 Tax=Bacillus cereus TaxID=1396 RepID=UPI00027AB6F5|nr:hypothetical protein [Bacillus cereus]EJS63444.1 hypothetical protein ICY_05281 [Bacillus cereus BAG2X1-3]
MRHTRNRQIARHTGNLFWLATKCHEMNHFNSVERRLDPTFKWEREIGRINFKPKKEQTHHMTVTIFRQVKTYK